MPDEANDPWDDFPPGGMHASSDLRTAMTRTNRRTEYFVPYLIWVEVNPRNHPRYVIEEDIKTLTYALNHLRMPTRSLLGVNDPLPEVRFTAGGTIYEIGPVYRFIEKWVMRLLDWYQDRKYRKAR
jgi:hypothetical protein